MGSTYGIGGRKRGTTLSGLLVAKEKYHSPLLAAALLPHASGPGIPHSPQHEGESPHMDSDAHSHTLVYILWCLENARAQNRRQIDKVLLPLSH